MYEKGETGMRKNIVTLDGKINLKTQIATSSWGGRRKAPYAFTEQGITMLLDGETGGGYQ